MRKDEAGGDQDYLSDFHHLAQKSNTVVHYYVNNLYIFVVTR